jgi:Protein of unknown function (DUF669)
MASLNGTFDATGVAPAMPLEVLPPGRYVGQIVESEMLPTKAGDGQYLRLVIEVLDGQYARRRIFDQLNLVNNSQQTVEIARRQLSTICHAVGQMQVTDSEQLHLRPLLVTLKVEPAGPDKHGVHREARNRVAGYLPAKEGTGVTAAPPRPTAPAPHPAAAAPPSATQPPAAAATPPWRRGA